MEIPDHVFDTMLERMKEIQLTMRDMRAELNKWRQWPAKPITPAQTDGVEPPTEKQIQFLRSLGVEDIPASKVEARRLLQELNAMKEAGEYSIPPTEKQINYLKGLKYEGPVPETKEEAWRLIQQIKGNE